MSRAVTSSTQDTLKTVSRLNEMGALDTLFRDVYLQRARELLTTVITRTSYEELKASTAEISVTEQQLQAAVERGEREQSSKLSERLKSLRTRISSAGQSMKLAETIYEQSPVSIDPFASGLRAFTGVNSETLAQSRSEALRLLESLKRSDPGKGEFYNRRRADFNALIVATVEEKKNGNDLLFEFSPQTLAAARELGLNPARLSFPSGPSDKVRDVTEFYLLNPFITSAGTRYNACLAPEDLLLEDFPEPDGKEEVSSKLLSKIGLQSRWGLTRLEIEDALFDHGLEILTELQLDPDTFRLVPIPADLYTHLAPDYGWGEKELWTHFDGYRVLEGGSLQALAGGDKRFGDTHDLVSFGLGYSNSRLFTRFAVVQRRRMMGWQQR
jgi:hypothetical protein